jgi:GNAT superfamily N-acetyltransferase
MRCEKVVCSVETIVPLSPRKLYPFLANIFPEMPPFDDWYVDVCYRVRHGFCHISAIEWEDMPISSAMTVAEWKDGAVIGAVATAAEHRRKGYAARCVAALTSQLQQAGKTVYICPKNAAAQKVYEQLGFVVCGKTAMIERK